MYGSGNVLAIAIECYRINLQLASPSIDGVHLSMVVVLVDDMIHTGIHTMVP